MPPFVNRCEGEALCGRLFSRALTASVFCRSPLRCAITVKRSAVALKKGTVTAENEDELSLLDTGGRKERHCCRL